jgi:hypothetical protein
MPRPAKVDVRDGFRLCLHCSKIKRLEDYPVHRAMKCGRRSNCKSCHTEHNYQRGMELKLIRGDNSIVECVKCGRYKRKNSIKECDKCRRGESEHIIE